MFCSNCGKPIADGLEKCPFCDSVLFVPKDTIIVNGAQNKKNHKVGCLYSIVIFVAIIAIIATIVIAFVIVDDDTQANLKSNTSTTQKAIEKEPIVIYEDNYLKASFIKVYSDPSVDSVVEGVAYLQLRVENKSNQTFTVSLSKAAINGMSTTIGSGLPMTILPGNSSEQPFMLFTNNTGVNNADDIKKVQFSFFLLGEQTEILEETRTITINVK